ncbi:MAG: indole-3-glycerol phosphate synthase TrpC [Pseudomonadota bacterium]
MTETREVPDILKRILERKHEEVKERNDFWPLRELRGWMASAPAPRGFRAALQADVDAGRAAVIAEIKKASPSQGQISPNFNPEAFARSYEAHGATCLSVLTDVDFFKGRDGDLRDARVACQLPILRKDFVVDLYQVYEARVLGADCVLLIVAALDDTALHELYFLTRELGMDALVEVHDAEELERARRIGADLIGINNRDLRSFETRLETTLELQDQVPESALLVTESGIHTREDVARLREAGVNAFLVGEAFMRTEDPGRALGRLFRDEG